MMIQHQEKILAILLLLGGCASQEQNVDTDLDNSEFQNENIADNQFEDENPNSNSEDNQFANENFQNDQFEDNSVGDNQFQNDNLNQENFDNNEFDDSFDQSENNFSSGNNLDFSNNNLEGADNFLNNLENEIDANTIKKNEINEANSGNSNSTEIKANTAVIRGNGLEEFKPKPGLSPSTESNEAAISPFSGSPAIPGTMRSMADGEAPNEYLVEYGDTLFDICSQLLGEGTYWPKLWSYNTYIKNPHFIWPGMRLRFYSGDEEDPPFIEIAREAEIDSMSLDSTVAINSLTRELILPSEAGTQNETVEVIGLDDIEGIKETFETIGWPKNRDKVALTLPGFIFSEQSEGYCISQGGANGESIVGEGRSFICAPNEELQVGKTYTALRFAGEVNDARTNESFGYKYNFVAHVKITRDLAEEDRYLGTVTQSRLGLSKDDLIVAYLPTERRISIDPNFTTTKRSDSKIIGFENQGQKVSGEGGLAFIDRGNSDGLKQGQVLSISQSLQGHVNFNLEDPEETTIKIGYMRVVDVGEIASIAYIISNKQEVRIGDQAGKE